MPFFFLSFAMREERKISFRGLRDGLCLSDCDWSSSLKGIDGSGKLGRRIGEKREILLTSEMDRFREIF